MRLAEFTAGDMWPPRSLGSALGSGAGTSLPNFFTGRGRAAAEVDERWAGFQQSVVEEAINE